MVWENKNKKKNCTATTSCCPDRFRWCPGVFTAPDKCWCVSAGVLLADSPHASPLPGPQLSASFSFKVTSPSRAVGIFHFNFSAQLTSPEFIKSVFWGGSKHTKDTSTNVLCICTSAGYCVRFCMRKYVFTVWVLMMNELSRHVPPWPSHKEKVLCAIVWT